MAQRDTSGRGEPNRKASDHLDRAQEEAADMGRQAMDAGRQQIGAAQHRIRAVFEQQTHRAADQLGGVASVLHQAAEQLDAENNGTAARYAVQAADRVEQVADMLRNSTVDDVVAQVEGFARRQPEVFMGAAFAVGFLFARFVKSSADRRNAAMHGGSQPYAREGGYAQGRYARGPFGADRATATRPDIAGAHPVPTGTNVGAASATVDTGARARAGAQRSTVQTRDAAELMAGGSPEPTRATGEIPDETLGSVAAANARPQETIPQPTAPDNSANKGSPS